MAARLNRPRVRVNLDSHTSRIDLVGKDSIVKEGKQVTDSRRHPALGAAAHIALVFDGTTPAALTMFGIQRVLEVPAA